MTRDQRSEIRNQGSGIRDRSATHAPCSILALSFWRKGGSPRLPIARVAATGSLCALLLLAGCRQDMQNQPKLIPQRGSEFFADHRGARPQVANTVARGQLREDSYFYTGVVQAANGYREEKDEMPFPVTTRCAQARPGAIQHLLLAVPLAGGQRTGRDCGARLQAGGQFSRPGAAFAAHLALLTTSMTHGYGAMPDYSAQLTPVGPLGGSGLHSRVAVEPGGQCEGCARGRRHCKSLKDDCARANHLPERFAEPWTLPATAIQAYPHDVIQSNPALASGQSG
jgi:hypothetical protein